MNKFCNLFLILTLCLFYNSCTIKGNFQGLYSYAQKTRKEIPEKFILHDSIDYKCDLTSVKNKIIITNGRSLQNCIKGKSVLIYNWGPNCSSKICYPLEVIQNKADELNRELFIVAEYYNVEKMSVDWNVKNPIFAIDTDYYDTNKTSRYLEKFYNELNINYTDENRYYLIDIDGTINTQKDILKI